MDKDIFITKPLLEGGEHGQGSSTIMVEFEDHLDLLMDHENPCLFFVHDQYKQFSARSLGCLTNSSKFRYNLVWFITWHWFEKVIISLIIVYSILLGMKDYTDIENEYVINAFIEKIDPVFNVIIYFEFLLKITAMGFAFGSNSYLSDGWNWLDFFVVMSSAATEIIAFMDFGGGAGKGLSALRAFRLLRPLKLLTAMPSMKLLLSTLFESVLSLGGILGLAIFCFTIFAILGVALMQGKIHYRCYVTEKPVGGEWELVPDFPFLCNYNREDACPTGTFCKSRFETYNADGSQYQFTDPNLWVDTNYEYLNYGITNFDSATSAFLTIFICTTMDGWTKIMNIHQDIYSSVFVHTFFIICIWICSFFILNLTIALMLMKYEQVDQQQDDKGEPDQFEIELREIGEQIFQEKHFQIIDFIIDTDGIQVAPEAQLYLKKEKSFVQSFFQQKHYQYDPESQYYQNKLPVQLLTLISHPLFDGSIMLVIVLNTVCLGMDKYPVFNESVLYCLSQLNIGFTIIFTAEVVIKIIALQPSVFFKEGFNIFDFFIVVTSLIQVALKKKGKNQKGGIFMILRTFRVFRIFKLFKVGDMKMLLDSIIFTISTIGPYVIFLSFCIYIFSLVGMSFYAGKVKFNEFDEIDMVNGISPRENFDSLGNSVLTIFQVLMGAGWSDIMFQVIRCNGPSAASYFVVLVVVGGIILMNLFLAIMLGNFEKSKQFGQKKKVFAAFNELMHEQRGRNFSMVNACEIVLGEVSDHVLEEVLKIREAPLSQKKINSLKQTSKVFSALVSSVGGPKEKILKKREVVNNLDEIKKKKEEDKKILQALLAALEESEDEDDMLQTDSYFSNSSLFIFHIDSRFRRFCLQLAEPLDDVYDVIERRDEFHEIQREQLLKGKKKRSRKYKPMVAQLGTGKLYTYFDRFILALIIISNFLLPMDNPLNDANSSLATNLIKINIVMTCFFVIEASVKIIAKGLMFNNLKTIEPYLSSGWNIVDIFVVCVSVFDIVSMYMGIDGNMGALKALRALRALRPLRVINRFENLKLIVNCLFSTFSAMQNVLMVGSLLLLIFSIMGVSFFKGKFFSCQDLPVTITLAQINAIITKQDCLDIGGSWENANQNFDNTVEAMSTLFQMMTTEGWQDVMKQGMDATDVDMQPQRDANYYMTLFFVAFMIIGSLFIMNLFVGVVIDNFNKIKEREDNGGSFVTETQKQWIMCQKIGTKISLKRQFHQPTGLRRYFFMLVNWGPFGNFITSLVILNTLSMAMSHYKMDPVQAKYLREANAFFSIVFNIEMVFKLIALRKEYFYNSWNLLDMFIVLSADIGFLLQHFELSSGGGSSKAITILRAFRILRVVKLLQRLQSIKVIIDAVLNILPNISNVMSLFVLALFIYSCVGISLFAGVKMRGQGLDDKNNFQTFSGSMLILMRFATGEDWNSFMYELRNMENCRDNQDYADIQKNGIQGCGNSLAIPYFISFQVVTVMLILNLTIAAVIDGLQQAQNDNDRLFKQEDINYFVDRWAVYDTSAKGRMSLVNFLFFLTELDPPFGLRKNLMMKITKDQTASCFINKEKNYMVKKSQLLLQAKDIAVRINHESNGSKYVTFSDAYSELIKRGFDEKNDGKFKPPKKKCTTDHKKKGKKKQVHDASNELLDIDESQQVSGWVAVDIIGENYLNKIKARNEKTSQVKSTKSKEQSSKFDVIINVYVQQQGT